MVFLRDWSPDSRSSGLEVDLLRYAYVSIYGCVCVLKQLICILLGEEPSINIPERKSMCATLFSWFCLSLSANISHGLSLLMNLQIGTVQSALLGSITGLFLAVDLTPQS